MNGRFKATLMRNLIAEGHCLCITKLLKIRLPIYDSSLQQPESESVGTS